MNIEAQCCGLVILICLRYFYSRQRKIGLKSEMIFSSFLYITIAGLIFDILSIVVLTASIGNIPQVVIDLIGKIYIALLVCVSYSAVMYLIVDFYTNRFLNAHFLICIIMASVGSVIVFFLPIKFYVEGRVVYSYGPATIATYIFCFLAFSYMGFCIIRYGKKIPIVRRNAMLIWTAVFIISAGIQFLVPKLLLVSFAGAVGMMITYLVLENPESNIDKRFGCFNSHAFSLYLAEKYANGEKFYLSTVSMIINLDDVTYIEKAVRFFHEFLRELSVFRNIGAFKMSAPEVVIVSEDENEMQKILAFISDKAPKIAERCGLHRPIFTYMPDSTVAQNQSEVLAILETTRIEESNKYNNNEMVIIDGSAVEKVRREEEVAHIIRAALEEDRVEIFFQPIYSIKERCFVSAEVLVRIRMPDGSVLPPDTFIPVAEKNGSVLEIGKRIFQKACLFLHNNKNLEQFGFKYLEINISGVQCEQENLAAEFFDVLTISGVSPSQINLEITETASIRTKAILLKNMKWLIEKGVSFSLDDFGNGRSNLNYLSDMPVSIVKFDQTVTEQFFKKEKVHRITTDVVRMLHNLNLKIVAEGVETKDHLDAMTILGVDYIQGYYFSRPIPTDDFLKFLEAHPAPKADEYETLEAIN